MGHKTRNVDGVPRAHACVSTPTEVLMKFLTFQVLRCTLLLHYCTIIFFLGGGGGGTDPSISPSPPPLFETHSCKIKPGSSLQGLLVLVN